MPNYQAIYIVILNWCNGQDTTECLQSIVDSASKSVRGVVICDNASGDGSVTDIRNWAQAAKISLPEYRWKDNGFEAHTAFSKFDNCAQNLEFLMIHTGANLGFAGGNNVGMEYLRRNRSFDFIFLLNNDALLTAGAVEQIASRFDDPSVGMCGCTVIYHHTPTKVQAFGGSRFQPLFGRANHIGAELSVDARRDRIKVESELDYILGVALMISRHCLDVIGMMEERYFLYYEEIDWATRAKRSGFRLAYAPGAVVYHKEGGTIGSSSDKSKRSLLSEHFLVRSRLFFTLRFYPIFFPTVMAFTAVQVARHLFRQDFQRFWTGIRAMLGLRFSSNKGNDT